METKKINELNNEENDVIQKNMLDHNNILDINDLMYNVRNWIYDLNKNDDESK